MLRAKGLQLTRPFPRLSPGLPSCEASPQEQMGPRKQVQPRVSPGAVASALVPWTEDRLDCLCHLQVQCGEGRKLFVYNYTLFLEFAVPIIVGNRMCSVRMVRGSPRPKYKSGCPSDPQKACS